MKTYKMVLCELSRIELVQL